MLATRLFRTLLLFIFAITLPQSASAETRIALIIGNSAYPSGPLGSPKDDARIIEAKLKILGFEVMTKTDLGREGFFNVIRDFGDRLRQSQTVGLFYYSGHGMQVNNRNYMVPTDADIRSEEDVARYAVPVEDVLARMEMGKGNPNIVILDACRDNPFEKRYKSSQGGLAQMDAPPSTLIAFAAAPGKVAEAGSNGRLSLYTEALTEKIDQPYSNFISMFQAVQNAVYDRSARKQSPRLELPPGLPDFSFMPAIAAMPSPAPVLHTAVSGAEQTVPKPNSDFSRATASDAEQAKPNDTSQIEKQWLEQYTNSILNPSLSPPTTASTDNELVQSTSPEIVGVYKFLRSVNKQEDPNYPIVKGKLIIKSVGQGRFTALEAYTVKNSGTMSFNSVWLYQQGKFKRLSPREYRLKYSSATPIINIKVEGNTLTTETQHQYERVDPAWLADKYIEREIERTKDFYEKYYQ
jgi:hypothetical protein